MATIEATSIQTPGYDSHGTTEAAQTQSVSADTATSETSGIDSAIVESKTTVADTSPAVAESSLDKVLVALTTAVSALIELVSSFIASMKSEKGSAPAKSDPAKTDTTTTPPTKTPGTVSTPSAPSTSTKEGVKHLEAIQDEKGAVTVRTPDGYIVRAEGAQEAWTITSPDGKTTRIFGDPHVKESDGTTWDFKQKGTFFFGKNKVTVETVGIANGETISSRITIYSGSDRVTIGGLDKNQPKILALSSDGKQHDDALGDGDKYVRRGTKNGESWTVLQGGKKKVMGSK